MPPKLYNRNLEIRDLPSDSDNVISTLAKLRGAPKWMIIREALIEYVKNHRKDIGKYIKGADGAVANVVTQKGIEE